MQKIRPATKITITIACAFNLVAGWCIYQHKMDDHYRVVFEFCEKLTNSLEEAVKCANDQLN